MKKAKTTYRLIARNFVKDTSEVVQNGLTFGYAQFLAMQMRSLGAMNVKIERE